MVGTGWIIYLRRSLGVAIYFCQSQGGMVGTGWIIYFCRSLCMTIYFRWSQRGMAGTGWFIYLCRSLGVAIYFCRSQGGISSPPWVAGFSPPSLLLWDTISMHLLPNLWKSFHLTGKCDLFHVEGVVKYCPGDENAFIWWGNVIS